MKYPLTILLVLSAAYATAHEVDVPSRQVMVDELRAVNAQLLEGRRRLGVGATGQLGATRNLNDAVLAFMSEDYERSAMLLLRLTSRSDVQDHPIYPEAQSYLGESLWQMGLQTAGITRLLHAVQHPRQTPSMYRSHLARYLKRASGDAPISTLRALWTRYQRLCRQPISGEPPALSDEDRSIRYHYAKALFMGGAVEAAEGLFLSVEADDPRHLQAHYFRAVIHLGRGDLLKARAAFELALLAAETRDMPADPIEVPEAELDGPAHEVVDLRDEDAEIELPDPETRRARHMHGMIHLALARMAAARGDDAEAWRHYRGVPRGMPEFAAALSEASFVLFRQGEYLWCARLVDQLLAGRVDDISAAQLSLWQAQLLARGGRFDDSRKQYERLEMAMSRRRDALTSTFDTDKRLFPQAVLAWGSPEAANPVRRLEAGLVTDEEGLLEAHELLVDLQTLLSRAGVLPTVRHGRELSARLRIQMARLSTQLQEVAAQAHAPDDDAAQALHGGGTPVSRTDVGALQRSLRTLDERITRFDLELTDFETRHRQQMQTIIATERPMLAQLQAEYRAVEGSAEALAAGLKGAARENLDRYAAEALFGQVDIAWWRKEAVSDKIRKVFEAKAAELSSLDAVGAQLHEPEVTDETGAMARVSPLEGALSHAN